MLAVYNWPRDTDRYRRVALFIDAFFSKFSQFQKPPRHGKWKEANLAATLRGWRRFPAAEEWLARNADKPAATAPTTIDPAIARAQAAKAAPNNPAEQERLLPAVHGVGQDAASARRRVTAEYAGRRRGEAAQAHGEEGAPWVGR